MKLLPAEIFKEYTEGVNFKNSLGDKGLYEQTKINERFYSGDQWYGARCGNDRPLVRHNIIKRIGDYKMSQIMSAPLSVKYSADGVPNTDKEGKNTAKLRREISADSKYRFTGEIDNNEINVVLSALSDYHRITAERMGFDALCARALKKAYISGSSVLYTYWDSEINTGLYVDGEKSAMIKGDIACELLDIENVYFGDPYCEDIEHQPYIILAARKDVNDVLRQAAAFGADSITLERIKPDGDDGKVLTLTKLYKEHTATGVKIKCVRVTENAVIRSSYDTRLRMYPLAIFRFEEKSGLAYGESEVSYLIPNQIAINRMITANVWSVMTMGMPLMVVNGDTVSGDISNDPGQIIKIYGSNEDVAGAVKYVTPPDFCGGFTENINNLIENTLTQSGANTVALGDERADNATALVELRNAAVMPLTLVKNRFYQFIEQIARIWADFWITQYGNRYIKVSDENGVWYLPFSAARYSGLYLTAKIQVGADTAYSVAESSAMLNTLYEKGIISKRQYLKRLPAGLIPDIDGIIDSLAEDGGGDLDGK